jgi:hypothetical protein
MSHRVTHVRNIFSGQEIRRHEQISFGEESYHTAVSALGKYQAQGELGS